MPGHCLKDLPNSESSEFRHVETGSIQISLSEIESSPSRTVFPHSIVLSLDAGISRLRSTQDRSPVPSLTCPAEAVSGNLFCMTNFAGLRPHWHVQEHWWTEGDHQGYLWNGSLQQFPVLFLGKTQWSDSSPALWKRRLNLYVIGIYEITATYKLQVFPIIAIPHNNPKTIAFCETLTLLIFTWKTQFISYKFLLMAPSLMDPASSSASPSARNLPSGFHFPFSSCQSPSAGPYFPLWVLPVLS